MIAGLPLATRIDAAAARAGFARATITASRTSEELRQIADRFPPAAPGARQRLVLLPANVVPQAAWLRSALAAAVEPDTLYVDASMTMMAETADAEKLLSAVAGCADAGEMLAALRARLREAEWPLGRAGRFVLAGPGDLPRVETWLLRNLIKPTEGFMSRHLERRISLAVTRRLVNTRMTPNAMTLVSVGIGLLGSPFFLSAEPRMQLTGALLFLTHSILDGCDGELARLKFMESRGGALLDFWGDNAVHVAVFLAMSIGWSWSNGRGWPLALGAVAIASTLGAAATLAGRGPGTAGRDAASPWTARLTDALANRDFIYLIALLAMAGKAWWFLVLVATGTPIFLLLCLSAGRWRQGAGPP
ncbi:MAG TPA: CDP-alcohol phosphatidyltransferase family protein [Candidatus Methylomirabilis sp.]|nr:CDP-alcohol phosphatidyltransferase family protein [Candidatus Methylomirabilis sp.]